MNMIGDSRIFLGTELKLNIHIEPIGDLTMKDYDFNVDVFCSSRQVVNIKKEEAIYVDDTNYIILIDTNDIGIGNVKCKITAYIPDQDFEDGFRTEICGIKTDIEIVKGL